MCIRDRYTSGIHYNCIPGEPGEEQRTSSTNEHVYSVIRDNEPSSSSKKQVGKQSDQQKQQQREEKNAHYRADPIRAGGKGTGAAAKDENEPIDMEGEGFIELMPRNMVAYDVLKRDENQAFPEVLLGTSGPYDKLTSPDECLTDATTARFNPYGQLTDIYESDNELPTMDMNPYDDTIEMTSQFTSLNTDRPTTARSNNVKPASYENIKKQSLPEVVPESKTAHTYENETAHAYKDKTAHAYDAIDELQKQIHILSQSIPTLDLYGYEDLDKVKPAPKTSRSIPMLDVAGYEDLDAVRPKQAQILPKRPLIKTQDVNFGFGFHLYEDITERKKERKNLGAAIDAGECPPLVPPRTIESLYTAVQKKPRSSTVTYAAGEKNKMKLETLYSAVQKRPTKSSSTTDLTETPPPVPPLTVEAMYTAVQKPRKRSATKGPEDELPPTVLPKTDEDENAPTVPPKTIASLYTAVQKLPKVNVTSAEAAITEEETPPPILSLIHI